MAGIIGEAFVRVRPDMAGFRRDVQTQTKGAFRGVGRAVGIGAGIGLGAVVANELRKSVAAAKDAEVANRQLQASLRALNISYRDHATQIETALQAQSRLSSFDDEELARSFTDIIRRVGDVNEALELNEVAANVARGRNISLSNAAQLIVRAYNGQVQSLRRLGLEVDKTTTREEALNLLRQKYAGAAVAYAGAAEGAQARLNKVLDDTREIVGGALLPVITDLAGRVADYFEEANRSGEVQRRVNDALEDASSIVSALADVFGLAHDAVSPLVTAVGGLENAIQIAIGAKLISTVGKAVAGFASMAAAFGLTSRKIIGDSVAMGAAIDTATRPRNIFITTTVAGSGTATAGGGRGGRGGGVPVAGFGGPVGLALLAGTGALYVKGVIQQQRDKERGQVEQAWADMDYREQREALRVDAGWRFFYNDYDLRLKPIPAGRPSPSLAGRPDEGTRGPSAPTVEPDAASTGRTRGATRLQNLRLNLAEAERRDDLQAQRRIQAAIVAIYQNRVDNTKLTGQALVRFKQELSDEKTRLDNIEDSIEAEADAKDAERAATREQNAQDAADRRTRADQKVLDTLTKGRRGTERRLALALDTEDPQDDVKAYQAMIKRIDREIASIRKNIKDVTVRTQELDRLAQERQAAVDNLAAARRTRDETLSERRQGILRSRITLAGLRGNEGAQVKFLDKLIADQRAVVARTKDVASKLLEQIELEQLIDERREILNEGRDEAGQSRGPSAYDLLTGSASRFARSAGNLIGPGQPFRDASGFSDDIAAWLRNVGSSAVAPVPGSPAANQTSTDRNTSALDRLTRAIVESGRSVGTSGETTAPGAAAARARGRRSGAVTAIERRWSEAGAVRAYIDAHGGN